MPPKRDPKRDAAAKLYIEAGGNLPLIDIAKALGVSPGSVRGWKHKDDWNGRLERSAGDVRNVPNTAPRTTQPAPNRGGAPKGNKNAVGNDGGAPEGNKNAVVTGEFERLFFSVFSEEEQQLARDVPMDKRTLLEHQISILVVRERRMLERIRELKAHERNGLILTSEIISVDPSKKASYSRRSERIVDTIQRIEEALTRVQAQLQRAIEQLHKVEVDHHEIAMKNRLFDRGNEMPQEGVNVDDARLKLLEKLLSLRNGGRAADGDPEPGTG